jgi:hypothetical protein
MRLGENDPSGFTVTVWVIGFWAKAAEEMKANKRGIVCFTTNPP